jgi:SanA protein
MNRRRWLRIVLLASLLLVVVFGAVAHVVVDREESRVIDSAHLVPSPRWVVVPGAMVRDNDRISSMLRDRLTCALDLWRAGKAAKILVSGDDRAEMNHETTAMRAWLLEQGVPLEAIASDPRGYRTYATMVRAAREFGVKQAVVCTSEFHLLRSLYLAHAAGIDALGMAGDRQVYRSARRYYLRERLAVLRAVADVWLGTEPG